MMFDVFIFSGGVIVTASGNNLDSVAAPVMAVTVELNNEVFMFHQVIFLSLSHKCTENFILFF